LQAHLKATLANATPKLLKELANRQFHQPEPKSGYIMTILKTLAITRTV
jgi:hypothetical protein